MRLTILVLLIALVIVFNPILPSTRAQDQSKYCVKLEYSPSFAEPSKMLIANIDKESVEYVPHADVYGADIADLYDAEGNVIVFPSPDGRYGLILGQSNPAMEIYDYLIVKDSEAKKSTLLKEAAWVAAAWSPDGTNYTYVWQETAGNIYLAIADINGGDERQILLNLPVSETSQIDPSMVSWSADGQYIGIEVSHADNYTVHFVSVSELTLMDYSFSLKVEYISGHNTYDHHITWAPQGHELAYASDHKLIIATPDKGIQKQFHATVTETEAPYWSPDGQYIAIQGYDDNVSWPLNIFSRDGLVVSEPPDSTLLPDRDYQYSLSSPYYWAFKSQWSTDGQDWFFIVSQGNSNYLAAYNVADKRYQVLMKNFGNATIPSAPVASPDISVKNDRLVVTTNDGISTTVMLMSQDGKVTVELAQHVDSLVDVSWSSGGDYVAITTIKGFEETLEQQLVWIRTDGTDKYSLSKLTGARILGWYPDSKTLLYVIRDNLHKGIFAGAENDVYDVTVALHNLETGETTKLLQYQEESGMPFDYSDILGEWEYTSTPIRSHYLLSVATLYPIAVSNSWLVSSTGELIQTFAGQYLESDALSPDGKMLAVLSGGEPTLAFEPPKPKVYTLRILALDGSTLKTIAIPETLTISYIEHYYWVNCPSQ